MENNTRISLTIDVATPEKLAMYFEACAKDPDANSVDVANLLRVANNLRAFETTLIDTRDMLDALEDNGYSHVISPITITVAYCQAYEIEGTDEENV